MRPSSGRWLGPALALILLTASPRLAATSEEVRSVLTRPGVTLGFLLVWPLGAPVASVIPPSDAPTLLKALAQSPRKEILTFEGGSPPRSAPCEALSPHGFLGIEADVVEAIARWIRARRPG